VQNLVTVIKNLTKKRLFWPIVALLAVLIFDSIFIDGFLTIELKNGNLYGRIIDIINRSSSLIIITIGMTLVIATGGIDISVGSVVAISGAITVQLLGSGIAPNTPFLLCIIASLAAAALLGCWNGFLVSRIGVQAVVATLILNVAGRGIAQLVTNGQIPTTQYKPFSYLAGFLPHLPIPFSIFIVAVVLTAIVLFVKKTAFGLFVESVGVNSKASRFAGLKAQRIVFATYAICGLCAGIAGLMISSMIKAADSNNAGLLIEMDAILAVAIGGNPMSGGKFSIAASVIGALIIQSLTTTLYAMGVSPEVLPVVKAIVVVIICLFQSEGTHKMILKVLSTHRRLKYEKTV
jgi:ribose/xylose/arabinose/galactoside ABC-type transport system permease subunit